jgi:hypothetical protein
MHSRSLYVRRWKSYLFAYLSVISVFIGLVDRIFSDIPPSAVLQDSQHEVPLQVFDCFLYHSESYMLYLHLLTLAPCVDHFVIGWSNTTFTNQSTTSMVFAPFEDEIESYRDRILYLYIDFSKLVLSHSKWRNDTVWRREATARNFLLEGVNLYNPNSDDLILLCDVDEITTRHAIHLIRRQPPSHYYNLHGRLYHYSFRWMVNDWDRPLVIRYGSLCAPLDDYKFMPFRFDLPGVLHHHCSFCFPTMREILRKLGAFSHTEFSQGKYQNPNYVYARIACGYGVLPNQWKMPERLTLVKFDSRAVFLPNDLRFDFLRQKIGFRDLDELNLTATEVKSFRPERCNVSIGSVVGIIL